jgi:hypothetical protein
MARVRFGSNATGRLPLVFRRSPLWQKAGEFLFAGRRGPDRNMTTRQYARLVSEWIGSVGLESKTVRHAFTAAH